jgi:hypothetical protein
VSLLRLLHATTPPPTASTAASTRATASRWRQLPKLSEWLMYEAGVAAAPRPTHRARPPRDETGTGPGPFRGPPDRFPKHSRGRPPRSSHGTLSSCSTTRMGC